MGTSVFLSRFMGLLRDKVISYYYGASPETDIYFASFAIPDFINYLLAGGYFSITLIPLMTKFFDQDAEDGWKFFSSAFWWVVITICALTTLAWIFAGHLSSIAAPGFAAQERERLTEFLRIILPAQACFLPGACFTAILFMRRQFSIPALTPLVYNGCIILGGVIFVKINPLGGMDGFLWGVLSGAALGSLLLPLLAVKAGGLRLRFVLRHAGLKKFVLLALPLMLGQSIVVLDEQFLRIFGSLGPEGSISLLNYARRLMMVPVGVVAQAAGVASYPFLASLAAKGDKAGVDSTVNKALLTSLAVIIPLSLWMMAASTPAMRLIFEQGRFSAVSTNNSAILLVIMLCATLFWVIQQVLGRGFYAHQNTLTPVLIGSAATLISLPLYIFLGRNYGAAGVAFAGVMAMLAYNLILAWRWNIHFGAAALHNVVQRIALLILLSAPCALLAFLATLLTGHMLAAFPLLGAAAGLAASLGVFGLSYLALCKKLAPAIWNECMGILKRRGKPAENKA